MPTGASDAKLRVQKAWLGERELVSGCRDAQSALFYMVGIDVQSLKHFLLQLLFFCITKTGRRKVQSATRQLGDKSLTGLRNSFVISGVAVARPLAVGPAAPSVGSPV